jgi:hypothetical protein
MFVAFFVLTFSVMSGVVIMIPLLAVGKQFYYGHICAFLHPLCITISALIYFFGRLLGHYLKIGSPKKDDSWS